MTLTNQDAVNIYVTPASISLSQFDFCFSHPAHTHSQRCPRHALLITEARGGWRFQLAQRQVPYPAIPSSSISRKMKAKLNFTKIKSTLQQRTTILQNQIF